MREKDNQKLLVPGKWFAEFDKDGNISKVVYDDSLRTLLEYTKEEFVNTQNAWEDNIHPEDQKRVKDYFTEVTKKHTEGLDYDIEYRMMTKNGYHWFHDYARGKRCKDGSLISLDGVIFDIQETIDKYANLSAQESFQENNARILALEDKFESLYDVDMESGQYEVYIKGKTFGDINTHLINQNDFFGDAQKNIEEVLYPDDREGVLSVLNPEYIRKTLKTENHFDWFYRMIVEGKPLWIKMRILYKDEEKSHIIVGVFNAEEEVAAKEKEQKLRDELVNRMARDEGLFLIDCVKDTRRTLHYNLPGAKKYNDNEKYSVSLERYINMWVAEFDRERIREAASPSYMLERLKNETEYTFVYRDTSTGIQRFYEMRVAKFSDTEVLQSFSEKDKEIIDRLIYGKLRDDYFAFFSIDLDDGLIQVQKETFGYLMGGEGTIKPYSSVIKKFSESYTGETKRYFEKISDIEYVKRKFATEDKSSFTFKSKLIDGAKWINITNLVLARHEDGSPSLCAMGFNYADSLETKAKETQEQIKEDMEMISVLASEYSTLYYYNIGENVFKIYSLDENVFPDVKKFIEKYKDPFELFRQYGQSEHVYAEDRKLFKDISTEFIREHLSLSKKFTIRFRQKVKNTIVWIEMDIVKYDEIDAPANAIAIGLAVRDKEIREEQERAQEQDLANQQRHIKSFGDMVNAALWTIDVNDDDEIVGVVWTPEFKHMLGFENEDVFPNVIETWSDLLHPDDKERAMDGLQRSLKSKNAKEVIYDFSYRMKKKNGEYCWYHAVGRMENSEEGIRRLYGVMKDISAEKRLEEQHALSDGLAREYHTVWLVEGSGEHKLHLYRSTGKKTVQSAVQRGLDEPTYDGTMVKYVMTSVHEDDRERVLEASKFETVVKETPDVGTYVVSYKRYYSDKDKSKVDYHQMCFAKAVADDGSVNYILAFRDADKMLREQIAQQQKLENALNMAQMASMSKTNFLFNMSHDIRTPMNAINGFASMAKKYVNNQEKVMDFLDKIEISGEQLLMLINQVLEMSRIESGKVEFEEKPVNIRKSFESMVTVFSEQANEAGLEFHHSLSDVKHFKVFADEARISQITLNITGNAIKYTPQGGRIDLCLKENKCTRKGYASFTFSVTDTGIGMSEEFLKVIYEPFSREKSSTVSKIQGTGLGMSIVKTLVDRLGGTIEIHSEPGKGSRIDVTLQFKLDEKDRSKSVQEDEPEVSYFKGRRALLVEDNEFNREIARFILEDQGLTVDEAEDGDIAVEMMTKLYKEGNFNYYDFILMDVQMPRMNGYEATSLIRKIPVPDEIHVPIIAITANAFEEDRQNALAAGMDAHLAKPIDIMKLQATLESFIA